MKKPLLERTFDAAVDNHRAGRLGEAEALYRKLLVIQPNHAGALRQLGVLATQLGQLDDAVKHLNRACALSPSVADCHMTLGNVLREKNDFKAAIDAYRQALRLNPRCYMSHDGLGAALRETGRLDEAVACHSRSLAINPGFPFAHYNLGVTLVDKGLPREAAASYRRAIAIHPSSSGFHWNLALALLALGEFKQGWPEYEWRWRRKNFRSPWPRFSRPRWNGEDLAGKTLLVHTEQGNGDAIQFVRYAPLLAARGARVVVLCQPALERLMKNVDGVAQVVASPEALPAFEAHCPMLSLPFHFDTGLESIPADVPYMEADRSLVDKWQAKAGAVTGRLRVGLVWAGSPAHENDRRRSLTLEQLAPLAGAGATFYSLQKGAAASRSAAPPDGMELIDLTDDLRDFADTAALISCLDLVITVDTAVGHLAGAIGKPAWVLLASPSDWRWLLNREDTPWYPTLRLFRQSTPGAWTPVIERVAAALSEHVQGTRPTAREG
jgi:Flp pilus assembly protein TadD